jgi:hypothetical protein
VGLWPYLIDKHKKVKRVKCCNKGLEFTQRLDTARLISWIIFNLKKNHYKAGFVYLIKTGSLYVARAGTHYVAQCGLEFVIFLLQLLSVGIAGVHHHTWVFAFYF